MLAAFNCCNTELLRSILAFLRPENNEQNNLELNDFIVNGVIDAGKIQEKAFPIKKADVFISHSHNDENIAKAFADMISCNLNLTSFLDSEVWLSADDILRKIDNHYCYNPNTVSYDYNMRNLTTSYVHMMLGNAIMQAMDSCSFVFFINTPNSICTESAVKNAHTNSPWLYYELSLVKYLHQKKLRPCLESRHGVKQPIQNFISAEFPANNIKDLPILDIKNISSMKISHAESYEYLEQLSKK